MRARPSASEQHTRARAPSFVPSLRRDDERRTVPPTRHDLQRDAALMRDLSRIADSLELISLMLYEGLPIEVNDDDVSEEWGVVVKAGIHRVAQRRAPTVDNAVKD